MSIRKIQTGDKVKVISGKYKGTLGQVVKVVSKERPGKLPQLRAVVTNIPKIAKFRKKNAAYNQPGQQLEIDRMLDLSNLSLVTSDGKVSKVKIELKDGKKVRVLKKNSQELTLNYTSKKALAKLTDKAPEKKETKKETTKTK